MCCVLWDLCVCFLCQDGIYISDVKKRFLKSAVTLCTKCRSKFYLPSLRQSTSVPCSPLAAGGTAQCEVGWWPCTLVLFSAAWSRLCACHGLTSLKYPPALGRADVHPETRNVAFGSHFGALSATGRRIMSSRMVSAIPKKRHLPLVLAVSFGLELVLLWFLGKG